MELFIFILSSIATVLDNQSVKQLTKIATERVNILLVEIGLACYSADPIDLIFDNAQWLCHDR